MKLLLAALLLLFLQPPPPVLLSATFTSSTSATVSWQQPPDPEGLTITCLVREYGATWPAGICYNDLPAGPMRVNLPGALTHPAYRPSFGDRYLLQINGTTVGSATLGEATVQTVYLGLIRNDAPEQVRRVYLAWVGR